MGLVDYSDSDTSDVEEKVVVKPASTSKPAFQKVVDRSNPGKIKVSLPQAVKEDADSDEPPSKRPKIGGGGLSGFMASLPAPKRTGQTVSGTLGGTNARKGLGAGVNLKTGATPGFSREPEPEWESNEYDDGEGEAAKTGFGLSLPPPKGVSNEQEKPAEEVTLVGKPMMFKPLDGEYKPIMYAVPDAVEETDEDFEASYEEYTPNVSFSAPPAVPTPPTSQSLKDIARDLNLSAAEERQLFGRGQRGGRATNIINFNTDQEYLHNEQLRASGEQAAHNPVRAIAPGKHSLKQLVSNAQSQKEALEESFAKGKSNRAEASSRYGW
jgi:hypothetical protein